LITRRNGEESIRDELTVCRWEEAYFGGNRSNMFFYFILLSPTPIFNALALLDYGKGFVLES